MRNVLVAYLLFLLSSASAAQANIDEQPWKKVSDKEFVLYNLEFALAHELSHALVDVLKLPLLGNYEDIADNLAITIILQNDRLNDDLRLQKLIAISTEWLAEWYASVARGDALVYWDSHPLLIQRYYTAACLTYGSNPEKMQLLREVSLIPNERSVACQDHYERSQRGWEWLMKTHQRPPNSALRGQVKVVIDEPHHERHHLLYEWVKQSKLFETLASQITHSLDLPEDIIIGLHSDCEGAYWNPLGRAVAICYGLLEEFLHNHQHIALHLARLRLEQNIACQSYQVGYAMVAPTCTPDNDRRGEKYQAGVR